MSATPPVTSLTPNPGSGPSAPLTKSSSRSSAATPSLAGTTPEPHQLPPSASPVPSSLGQSYVSVVQSASAPSASNSTEKVEVEITEEGIAEAREEFFKGLTADVGLELRKASAGEAYLKPKKKAKKKLRPKTPQDSLTTSASRPQSSKKKKGKAKKVQLPYSAPSASGHANPSDDLSRTKHLLTGWGDLSAVNEKDDTTGSFPLALAATKGLDMVVEALVGRSAELNQKDKVGRTALYLAASFGRRACVAVLLLAGSDMECDNDFGNSPLHAAVRNGHNDVVEMLVMNGANVAKVNSKGEMPLDKAKTPEMTKFLNSLVQKRVQRVEAWNAALEAGKVEGEIDCPPIEASREEKDPKKKKPGVRK